MAQAGAQREPSMEEILASIRRIIESNEPGEQPLADDSTDADLDAAADADVGRLSHASLADVAARVRAEGAGSTDAVRENDPADLMHLALVSDQPEPEQTGQFGTAKQSNRRRRRHRLRSLPSSRSSQSARGRPRHLRRGRPIRRRRNR